MTTNVLLEREEYLADLRRLLDSARSGSGSLVFVGGETGVGKTTLIRRFIGSDSRGARVLLGSCEPSLTPSPLWPLREMAITSEWAPGLAVARGAPRHDIFSDALADLSAGPQPTVLIIEDVHWADDSTLDFLRFLGRRIGDIPVLAIASHRNDDLRQLKPLKMVFGDLVTTHAVRRVALSRLSLAAVAELAAGRTSDVNRLYERTLGNPFFVTEVLASDGDMPDSILDGVLARVGRVSPGAREVLSLAAVRGPASEHDLFTIANSQSLIGDIEECIDSGILIEERDRLVFRHDLFRESILNGLSHARRAELSGRLLQFLESHSPDPDPSVLAELSAVAGYSDRVARYATIAGDRALELRSYREASAQFRRAIDHSGSLSAAERSTLLHKLAESTYFCGRGRTGIEVLSELIELHTENGDHIALAQHLALLCAIHSEDGHFDEALPMVERAIELINRQPREPVHGEIYQIYSHMMMLIGRYQESISWGERAHQIALEFEDLSTAIRSQISTGSSLLQVDEDAGVRRLETAAEQAERRGYDNLHAQALGNLGEHFANTFRPLRARPYLEALIAATTECSLDCWRRFGEMSLGVVYFFTGDWNDSALLSPAMSYAEAGCIENQLAGVMTIGRLRARRGDPDAWAILDRAAEILPLDASPFARSRLHVARTEAAWLTGDHRMAVREATAGLAIASEAGDRSTAGELAWYLDRSGITFALPFELDRQHALERSGDWNAAAVVWNTLGCPYEAARALSELSDPKPLREALAIFDRLGARPMALEVKRKLRDLGASIPRGPRMATRGDPLGLTSREAEVLQFVSLGWTNIEIADRLFLSPKTIERHLSSIYGKLDVRTRREAGARLRNLTQSRPDPMPIA
jgi:DNA-binding CsgD family transcriptional regulator/tetratricopeptide (TPR) repeat protein